MKKIHYGWMIVLAGMLCIFGCIGVGRFALGMLLPSMAEPLRLTYAMMGVISTSNFIGYLGAVLLCGKAVKRWGARRVIVAALFLVFGSMTGVGLARNYLTVVLLYTLTGVGSALANVPMMSLAVAWFSSGMRGRASGFMVIGSGFAILLSGRLVPFLNGIFGPEGWRYSWFSFAFLVLCIAIFCGLVLRNHPEEKGLQAIGGDGEAVHFDDRDPTYGKGDLWQLAAIYFLFGVSYVIYATFFVTALVQDKGLSEATAGAMWSWVGIISLFSGPVFGTLSDYIGRRIALILVFSLQTCAYLLAATQQGVVLLMASVVCYGLVAWSIPSIMAALVGDVVGARKASAVFGFVTFIFAIGQIVGPALAGQLAERYDDFSGSFYLAAVSTLGGVLLSLLLRVDRRKRKNLEVPEASRV